MANVAVSIFGTNTPIRLVDLTDGSYALTTRTVTPGSAMGSGDKALSLFGVNLPVRVIALGDGSYALATAFPVSAGAPGDASLSLFGINAPTRLVALGDGTYALGVAPVTTGDSQAGVIAASILGTNTPIRLVRQAHGDHALGVAPAVTPRPAADCVASLFGINPSTRLIGVGDGTYAVAVSDYMIKPFSIFGSNLVLYLPLTETSGITAADLSTTRANGTYNSVTLAQIPGAGASMGLAPMFDAINDNITFAAGSLAALNTAWNPSEFTLSMWFKMDTSADWSNATQYGLLVIGADISNRHFVYKDAANEMRWQTLRNGQAVFRLLGSLSTLNWAHIGLSVSKSSNFFRAYWLGAQVGADQAVPETFFGSLTSDYTQIGSINAGILFCPGSFQHIAIGKTALPAPQMAQLAVAS